MVFARVCFGHCPTIWPAEVTGGGTGTSMRPGQEKVLMLPGRFVAGLTGRKTATKINLIEYLRCDSGRDDKVANPMEYYQEAVLFLLQ
jgi:hypothetical protein